MYLLLFIYCKPCSFKLEYNYVTYCLYANYKIAINKYLEDVRIEDIFLSLQCGQNFSKLDVLKVSNQLLMDVENCEIIVYSTSYGILKMKHLPFKKKQLALFLENMTEN